MSLNPLKWTAAVLLALGLGAAGVLARQSPEARDGAAPPPRELSKVSMLDYVVEPPDMILVEVLEALPGRPISGERLVRPDGKISLGFYGEVYVAGLTTAEIKEKIIQHLRKHLGDEQLGLVVPDPERPGRTKSVAPADSARVYVDVKAYNSKNYYVQGDVSAPGRLPITGNDTVLDAINYAGGLQPTAWRSNIRLVRPPAPGADRPRVLKVDYEAIAYEGDPSTNYQLLPGDRVIVLRDPKAESEQQQARQAEVDALSRLRAMEQRLEGMERKLDVGPKARTAPEKEETALTDPTARAAPEKEETALADLQQRLGKVERKLDRVIELLGGVPK
jgi:polysaccharide export outer membrane protein